MRRWTEEEDVILQRNVPHHGYEKTLRTLHRNGFTDRTYGSLRKRCRDALEVAPGENGEFTRVVNIDPGDGRATRKTRFTRKSVLTAAERDGVLRYAPAGRVRVPYVPMWWADQYIEKLNEESPEGRVVIRRRWWSTKRVAAEFGVSLKTIYQQLPFVLGRRERDQQSYRYSCRPYLLAIPRTRVGRRLFWQPERAKTMAGAFQRRMPPDHAP